MNRSRRMSRLLLPASLLLTAVCVVPGNVMAADASPLQAPAAIICRREASSTLQLAAREVQRYVYVRTGELLPIVDHLSAKGDAILLASDESLRDQQYRLQTTVDREQSVLRITGGSDIAVLYGVYQFAERLGIRFSLDADVIPDQKIAFALPRLDETHAPLFELRGIQPYHIWGEGPDWWSVDDYKAYIAQVVKLRMNILGLHCHPGRRKYAPASHAACPPEPSVWIGLPEDVNDDGTVKFSYPACWYSTSGGRVHTISFSPVKTSDFTAGAALLFERDHFGSPLIGGQRPLPETVEQANASFNQAGRAFSEVFTYGHELGIRSCLGLEAPLSIPPALAQHLSSRGMDPEDPQTLRLLYEGMFRRIARTHPLDYFWLWTEENWSWIGTKPGQVEEVVDQIKLALEAMEDAGSPFRFATCGWVLGPPANRSLFDEILPPEAAVSCINRNVGFTPVEPGFARIDGRPQWAIPWLEDDPAMTIPQLWVGRTRRDAADAHAYGCTGLLGIHWRTRVISPNVAALAAAGWDQKPWNRDVGQRVAQKLPSSDVCLGGHTASTRAPIAETEQDGVYQTCRYKHRGYRVKVPNGRYQVTLQFCEPHFKAAGQRVFGVKLQGRSVIERLDVFERVGLFRALDFAFEGITVTDGILIVDFVQQVASPMVSGIVIEGKTKGDDQHPTAKFTRKINCGSLAAAGQQFSVPGYELDLQNREESPFPNRPRDLSAEDFYIDWCRAQFGPEVADPLAALFDRLDGGPGASYGWNGPVLPRPVSWTDGPGGIVVNGRAWELEEPRYTFVDDMAALRCRIQGAGNLERFDYWLNSFRYLRAVGQIGCTRGKLDQIIAQIDQENDPAKKRQLAQNSALPVRLKLARQWEQMMTHQLAVVDTPGEMGTISNLEQHVRRHPRQAHLLDAHDQKLAELCGGSLPDQIHPVTRYLGEPRIIVPTKRTQIAEAEALAIKVIVLDNQRPTSASLYWRPMGQGEYRKIDLTHVARGVYSARVPSTDATAIEYFIRATTAEGQHLVWPPTAPALNQTVVVAP